MTATHYHKIEFFAANMYTFRINRIGEECISITVHPLFTCDTNKKGDEYTIEFTRDDWFMFVQLIGLCMPPSFHALADFGVERFMQIEDEDLTLAIRGLPSDWKCDDETRCIQIRTLTENGLNETNTIELDRVDMYNLIAHAFLLLN